MSRERAPRPGVTWETELVRVETVEDTGPRGWASDPGPSETAWPHGNRPCPPRPNRATRRAQAKAARRNRKDTA